jgi:hypothetical protein
MIKMLVIDNKRLKQRVAQSLKGKRSQSNKTINLRENGNRVPSTFGTSGYAKAVSLPKFILSGTKVIDTSPC